MRRSLCYLLCTAALISIVLTLPLHARHGAHDAARQAERTPARLSALHVTDLCLTTEARYTRHPALADRHAPFQDHPGAREHFPSGSLLLPAPPPGQQP